MKTFLAGAISAVLGGVLVFGFVARNKEAEVARRISAEQERWAAEKAQMESQLQAAKRQPARFQAPVDSNEPTVASERPDAQEIIEKLKALRANSRDPRSIRKVIYHLEQLREIGPEALPPIRAFLARFEDVDYQAARQERQEEGGENNGGNRERRGPNFEEMRERFRDIRGGNRGDTRLSFVTPPSLRMGLFDVVQGIGGAEAEEILANIMSETGRPVELAYISKLLEEVAQKKYAPTAIAAAKDLLLDLPQASGGNRLDENSKDYLYDLLMKLGDTSFAANAQGMLVAANGQLDRRALSYVNETLKDQAMPAIFAAYNDPRITNQMDKATLMNMALKHAGLNQQANEMLNSVVGNEQTPTAVRAMAIAGLTRDEPTPDEIRARLPVVEALKGSTSDERLQRALDVTYQNLQNMLAGMPADDSMMREVLRGGGRDGNAGGFRGGRNGGGRGQGSGAAPRPQG